MPECWPVNIKTLNMKIETEQTIGSIVAEDYRTASVFQSMGIDFCCRGNRTLQEVCDERSIDTDLLLHTLEEVMQTKIADDQEYHLWNPEFLCDYIERVHHTYVNEKILQIQPLLEKLCRVHGKAHPELFRIRELFLESAGELSQHMKKEELILFPYIRKLNKPGANGRSFAASSPFGSIQNPIAMMQSEHIQEGERFAEIAQLSSGYNPPADACATYRVTYSLLNEFERDLHLHIHLENNILFPKALQMEKNQLPAE